MPVEGRIVTLEIKVEEMLAAVKDTNEKEKVAVLGTKVKDLQEAVTNKPLKNKIATIECELSNLKKLIRKPEQSELSRKTCAICSKTYLKNAELEEHMSEEHNSPKDFECPVCGKKFFLEWRLKKHARMHTVTPGICRYFSTKIACPFMEIGCKFSHTFIPDPAMLLETKTQSRLSSSITMLSNTDRQSSPCPALLPRSTTTRT